jgi:hypothetical protein
VTVGQDVAKLETGEGGGGGTQEASTPAKEPASDEQPAPSVPEPKKEEPKKEAPAPPKEEKKPPPPAPSEDKPTSKRDEKKPEASSFGAGSRGENRVRLLLHPRKRNYSLTYGR